uniref:Uncharacterized protein n=1 Tax=Anguilla anguilla TaxID=7936 RepID=A0A0E9SBL0_ANGAN
MCRHTADFIRTHNKPIFYKINKRKEEKYQDTSELCNEIKS